MNEQDLARLIATLEHLKHPFDRKQISKLPASDKRPALDYVNHAHVTNRLNQYAPDWNYTLDEMFTLGSECWVRGTMTIFGASRVEFGKGKNPLEAMSHFIRRAAMRFGVATDLWAKEDFEEDSARASSPTPARRNAGALSPAPAEPASPLQAPGGLATSPAERAGDAGSESGIGEGANGSEPATRLATDEQWRRLLEMVDGSMVKAVNKINRANAANYTRATAQEGATWDELVAAMSVIYALALISCGVLVGVFLGAWFAVREAEQRFEERQRLARRYR